MVADADDLGTAAFRHAGHIRPKLSCGSFHLHAVLTELVKSYSGKMKLKPLDTSTVELVAARMAEKENYQWLDFGSRRQILTPVSLRIMMQRDTDSVEGGFSADPCSP